MSLYDYIIVSGLSDSSGGGGSEAHLYQHNLNFQGGNKYSSPEFSLVGTSVIITNSSEQFTVASLAEYLYTNGFISTSNKFNISGLVSDNNASVRYLLCGMWSTDGTNVTFLGNELSQPSSINLSTSYIRNFDDTVVQII